MATNAELEQKLAHCKDELEDANCGATRYRNLAEAMGVRLQVAADILALHGHLIDTPQAKLRWIEKGDGLVWRR